MLKKLMSLLAALLVLGAMPVKGAEAVYINTETELAALSQRVSSGDSMSGVEVYLTSDITLTSPFTPIGNADAPFCGSFYGGGHTLKGLTVERADSYNGLFGCIVGGSVKGLRVENARIKGGDYSAVIAGRIYSYEGYSAISDCYATGTVEGDGYVGGIAGLVLSAAHGIYAEVLVNDSTFDGNVKGNIYVGGICGKASAISTASRAESRIEGCLSYGTVRATGKYGTMAGGICGGLSSKSDGGSSIASVSMGLSYANSAADRLAAGGVCGVVGAEGYGATSGVYSCVAFGSASALSLAGGIAASCERAEGGVTLIKGSVAGGNVIGGDIHPIAKGEGVESCFGPEDMEAEYPIKAEPPLLTRGDVNGDGMVDNSDAALTLKYDAGIAILATSVKETADINGDKLADNSDAAAILKYDAGITDKL